MKSFLMILSLFLCFNGIAQSVEKPNKKSKVIGHDDFGSWMINSGLGINNQESLPYYFNTEFFVSNDFSIGFQLLTGGYRFTENGWNYKTNNLAVGGLINYHINTLLNISYRWDFYIGGSGGYTFSYIFPDDWNAPDVKNIGDNGAYFYGQVGARYYIWERLGINAEAYYGNFKNGANFGLTIKF